MSMDFCIICQRDKLGKGTLPEIASLKNAFETRQKLKAKYRDDIERLQVYFKSSEQKKKKDLVWHKNSFANFTDKGKIKRLQVNDITQGNAESTVEIPSASISGLRSQASTDWTVCIFFQKTETNQRLSGVFTMNMNKKILEASKYEKLI